MERQWNVQTASQAVMEEATRAQQSTDLETKRAAIATIEQQRSRISEDTSGFDDLVGGIVAKLSDTRLPAENRAAALRGLDKQEAALRSQLDRRRVAEERVARVTEGMTKSLEAFGRGVSSARGVNPPPATVPGSEQIL
jgi:chromosome segregation ATPase